MTTGYIVWRYLVSRPLNSALNILLLGLGIAVVAIVISVNHQLREKISANARGIDLVVGAKGSPLQLILSSIFHIDYPTGNISLAEAERIARHRLVRQSIPLALGDSYQGFRIVGTTREYAGLYDGSLATGSWPEKPMEVVAGHAAARMLNLETGARFASTHGLGQAGHAHDDTNFVVTGVLAETNTVLDQLLLTPVESVWEVHGLPHTETAGNEKPSALVPSVAAGDSSREITSVLLRYRSAMGAIQLPRWVNGQSRLQAASPAYETARLFSIMGVGIDALKIFAGILIFISALSIFIALYNSLKERRYDLAIMRTMGASRFRIFFTVLLEGALLTLLGTAAGLVLAHGILEASAAFFPGVEKAGITGAAFYEEEAIILVTSVLLGMLCALIPAWQAYRTDISRVLAGG